MELTAENIRDQIPYYLTKEQKDGLIKALSDFPSGMNYYTKYHPTEMLQGDCWTPLYLFNYATGERKTTKGILLSNSCDISPENKRDTPTRILFSPLIRLESYIKKLEESKISKESIDSKISAIKEQKVSSIFFLPRGGDLNDDHIAVLDDIHTIPADAFAKQENRSKLTTLSLHGFYLFLLKLSIHFCRFHEKLDRDQETNPLNHS